MQSGNAWAVWSPWSLQNCADKQQDRIQIIRIIYIVYYKYKEPNTHSCSICILSLLVLLLVYPIYNANNILRHHAVKVLFSPCAITNWGYKYSTLLFFDLLIFYVTTNDFRLPLILNIFFMFHALIYKIMCFFQKKLCWLFDYLCLRFIRLVYNDTVFTFYIIRLFFWSAHHYFLHKDLSSLLMSNMFFLKYSFDCTMPWIEIIAHI